MNLNNKGFTLIEVIAVLVVLSAIVGLSIPTFTSMLDKNKISEEEKLNDRIKIAAEIYMTDYRDEINKWKDEQSIENFYITVDELVSKGYFNLDGYDDEVDGLIITDDYNVTSSIDPVVYQEFSVD